MYYFVSIFFTNETILHSNNNIRIVMRVLFILFAIAIAIFSIIIIIINKQNNITSQGYKNKRKVNEQSRINCDKSELICHFGNNK